jgi:pyridoxamine 5'-phosphate oxidase
MDLSELRAHYNNERLQEPLPETPWPLVQEWFKEALSCEELKEPNAMSLATVDEKGQPAVRLVLVKEIQKEGVVFFTNYESQKGQHIAQNPKVAGTVWWPELERQIRIEGQAEKIAPEESSAYFKSRPKGSQIGAKVSPQSRPIPNAAFLEEKLAEAEKAAENKETLERPSNWGGYLIRAHRIELWLGQANRLHDRILYEKEDVSWKRQRLAP